MDPETFESRQKNFEEFKKRQEETKEELIAKKTKQLRHNSSGSLGRKDYHYTPKAPKIAANLPWTMTKEEWVQK